MSLGFPSRIVPPAPVSSHCIWTNLDYFSMVLEGPYAPAPTCLPDHLSSTLPHAHYSPATLIFYPDLEPHRQKLSHSGPLSMPLLRGTFSLSHSYLANSCSSFTCVLARSCCYNQIPQTGGLETKTCISHSSGAWKTKVKEPAVCGQLVSGEALNPNHLPEDLLSNTITLAICFQHMNLEGDKTV